MPPTPVGGAGESLRTPTFARGSGFFSGAPGMARSAVTGAVRFAMVVGCKNPSKRFLLLSVLVKKSDRIFFVSFLFAT